MMRRCAAVLLLIASHVVAAQNKLVGITGIIYRYRGDTIWVERDSTSTRVIYRGDTVARTVAVNGQPWLAETYLLVGDSARVLFRQVTNGGETASTRVGPRALPALVATMERNQLENELRSSDARQRVAELGVVEMLEPPTLPDPARTYVVSPTKSLIQHRDTVWYVTGCPALGRTDTTEFLMYDADSTRRLTSPQRMFGEPMATGLIGYMRGVVAKERLAQLTALPADKLPVVRNQCEPRK